LTQAVPASRINVAEPPPLDNTNEIRMKIKLLFPILVCCLPSAAEGQTADEIVKKAVDARGGIEKIKAVQSERITARLTSAPGVGAAVILELKRPHKMHSEITVEGQKIIRVYDGKSGGWSINPFTESKDVQPMSAEDLKEAPDESDMDGPLVDYKSKSSQIELVGKEDLDGKPVYRLKLTNKNGDVRSYLLDASSFLTVKWEGIRKIEGKELPWESSLVDYHEIQGMKFPFKIEQGSPGTELKQALTIEKIEIDPKIDESHFAKPASPEAPAAPATPTPTAT
jgi:outer membrane lipoprotein-sorting protein